MVSLASKFVIAGVVIFGVVYQFLIYHMVFNVLGYGRKVASIKDYPNVRCEKVDELGLEGCEDMWLHQKTGFLYMACSDTESRQQWLPAINNLNATGRGTKDRIAVLDTRGAGRLASRIQWLSIENFSGTNGDGILNLHGLDIREDKHTDVLRILLVNHRPSINAQTGEVLDATLVGANSTIELFQTKAGSSTMRHVRTYFDEAISTPNRVAWVNDDSFLFTNDNSAKLGIRRRLDVVMGGGSVGFCNRNGCNIAYSTGFNFPNGLVRGRDGLFYVPNTVGLNIDVFSISEDHKLSKVHTIKNLLPLDNLSLDGNGNIIGAAFPVLHNWSKGTKDPFNINPESTVLKIIRAGKGYQGTSRKSDVEKGNDSHYIVETVFEDNSGVLPGATVAIHDTETGRFFLGGSMSPFITICETR